MVSLPVPPVKAPSPNSCSPASKPFPCHTFTRSSKSSTLSSATATPFDSIFGVAKPFALISFADPRPLNSVVSYRYKKSGERAVSSHETVVQLDCIFDCANSFALNSFADPHPLNLYGSIFYKKVGGRGGYPLRRFIRLHWERRPPDRRFGQQIPDLSFPCNFPNSPDDSSCQKLAAQKSGFVILKLR